MTLLEKKVSLLPVVPINMQNYAQALIKGTNQNTNFYVNATIYSQLQINIISLSFTNGWPFSFTTGQIPQVITENIQQDFGYISAFSMANMVNLTTDIHIYLDSNLLLIFFVDTGNGLLGTFIGPGIIDLEGSGYTLNNVAGSWSS